MNIKTILRTICLVSLPAVLASGQTDSSITGTIRDPQQAGIAGAHVTLVARDNTTRISVSADGAGKYRFGQVAPGDYLLAAEAQGFASSVAPPLQIAKGAHATVDLSLPLAGLQTKVVVTASGTAQTTDELSKALTVIDKQTIDLRGDVSIADVLRGVPGLRIQQLGGPGAMTSIKTRGLRNEDTAVLIDGFRLRDAAATQGDASAFLQDLLVANIDRVEVLRGAGSSIYGTHATGGVVNIATSEGGGRTHGSLLLEGGSLDMIRSRATVGGSLGQDRLQYSLGASHLNVMGGLDGHSPARDSGVQGRLGYIFSSKVRLSGRIFATDGFTMLKSSPQGAGTLAASGIVDAIPLPGAELRRYEAGTPVSQITMGNATFIPASWNPDYSRAGRVFSGALNLSLRPAESLGLTASYQGLRTRRRFGDGPAGPAFQPMGSSSSFYDGEIHTANGRMDWQLGRVQMINAGYEFEIENYGNSSLLPNPATNSAVSVSQRSHTFFAQDQFHLLEGRLQFAVSYRLQRFTLDQPLFAPAASAPYSGQRFDAPPTAQTGDGSAAYTFRKSGTKLRGHVGRGYRAPSLYERFGSYYGSYGYSAYGDPRLRPDRSIAVDGGVDQTLWNSRARLSATYFYTQMQEVIIFDFSGAINPTVDPFGRYGGYRNTNGGLARGVELSASLSPTRSLDVTAAYTYTNARQRTPLADGVLRSYVIPNHQFSLAAVQRVSARLTVLFDVQASGNYLAPIYHPTTYVSRAYRFPGIARVSAGANYRLPLGEFRALRFYGNVENLLNQSYYENGFRTPGATARGGLQLEF